MCLPSRESLATLGVRPQPSGTDTRGLACERFPLGGRQVRGQVHLEVQGQRRNGPLAQRSQGRLSVDVVWEAPQAEQPTHKNVSSQSFGGWKSKIRASVGLVPSGDFWLITPAAAFIFTERSPCVHLCLEVPFL